MSRAQIDLVAGKKVRRRPAVLAGRNKPKRNARRRRELLARPIQALASLAALFPGHFATPALPSASVSKRRMASDRDGRGSGCATSQASSESERLDGRRKPIKSPWVTPDGRPCFFVK